MLIIPTSWELASLVCKLILYFGAASIAGGTLRVWQFSEYRRSTLSTNFSYILCGALLGFHAVILGFLVQVGLVTDRGLLGMFDWNMASILLDTSLGDVTFLRLAGFALALAISYMTLRKLHKLTKPPTQSFFINLVKFNVIALLMLAISFQLAGHASVLSSTARIAIVLHFLAFSTWIGSLYPLFSLTRSSDPAVLKLTMKRFGDSAIVVLAILFIAGLLLVLQLISSPSELISTAYGRSLLIKFALVICLLSIAALNKLVLVPKLGAEQGVLKLRASIRHEMFFATLILLITSYLSTIVGPPGH